MSAAAPGQAERDALEHTFQRTFPLHTNDFRTKYEQARDAVMAAADDYAQAAIAAAAAAQPGDGDILLSDHLRERGRPGIAAMVEAAERQAQECDGLCMTAAEVGVPVAGNPVAYAHPGCPAHDPAEREVPAAPGDAPGNPNDDFPVVRSGKPEVWVAAPGDAPELAALLDHETRLTWQSGLAGERARVAEVRARAGLEAL